MTATTQTSVKISQPSSVSQPASVFGSSKVLPATVALAVNAVILWGALNATSVLPPERVAVFADSEAGQIAPASGQLATAFVARAGVAALVQ